ncbi:threonine/serine exporter family protein [Cellulomonas sp. ATA003]|uniref:threonine/serine ThrE exporter family protein n=1 Tax=Cellulomonas sp. ATA003 TaxID=3073064 RepID=UPI002873AC48|nr:threonine/serine exporter family protein [Cellulomonas sp. ATA003]WNB87104.1 threonine/serine exporter family protein [Cellulomonas sp. ATA003]
MTPPPRTHVPEDELEPVELIRQSGVVLRTGRAMLAAGTGSYRVKTAMQQVARAVGLDRHEAHVTLTEITATSHRGSIFRTEVTEARTIGVNSDRLAELTRLCDGLRPGATVDEVDHELDRIEAMRPRYPAVANALFAAMACGAFAYLNAGGVIEVLGVALAAGLGQAVRRAMLHRRINQFGTTMVAAGVACLVYLGFVLALEAWAGAEPTHQAGYVSAVLFLVPGFALVTAALDLAKLDFSAGIARTVYANLVLISAGLSVWGVLWVTGVDAAPLTPEPLPAALELALRLLASFLGVLGFALMFNSPVRMALGAAGIGMVTNVLRLELVDLGVAVQAATMGATLLVGLLAAWVAPRLGVPRITISVPAVVIMVPGAAVYRAVVGLNDGDAVTAFASGTQALFVVVSIAVGLAAARMLTDRAWAYER